MAYKTPWSLRLLGFLMGATCATGDGFWVNKLDGYKLFQYLEATTIIVLFG
jgi:hypothetical protein